jgi:ABC-type amino acid transport system permease subunit
MVEMYQFVAIVYFPIGLGLPLLVRRQEKNTTVTR